MTGQWDVTESGSGDPLVLVHGLGTDSSAWNRVQPLLAQHFRVLAVDLPGYSLGSDVADVPSGDELAAGLVALLDGLGVDTAVVVGHSFGGAVALLAAHHFPTRVAGLALIAPGGFGKELNPVVPFMKTRAGAATLRALYRPRASRTIERIARRVESSGSAEGKIRIAELMETYDRLRTERAREQFRTERAREPRAERDDRSHPGRDQRRTSRSSCCGAARIGCCRRGRPRTSQRCCRGAGVRMLDRAGHTPHRSDPRTVAGAIAEFAGGRGAPPPGVPAAGVASGSAGRGRTTAPGAPRCRRWCRPRHTDCQVPSCIRPPSTGTVTEGATNAGSTWSRP